MIMTSFLTQKITEFTAKASAVALMLSFVLFFSCSQHQTGIQKLEIGENGVTEAFIGQLLPIRAEIELNEKIASIDIHIVPVEANKWSFNQQYTEAYAGRRTALFEENIQIPDDAKVGNYELTIKVVGESGVTTEKQTNIRISVDSTVPIVGDLDVGINPKGNDLHLEADITATKKIKQVTVEIKGETWSKDFVFDKPQMKDQLSYKFHEHVHVEEAPKGEYKVVLTLEDQSGRKAVTTKSFQKK